MYVMSGEVLVVAPILHKLKRQAESDDECASEPAKGVYTFHLLFAFSVGFYCKLDPYTCTPYPLFIHLGQLNFYFNWEREISS